MALTSLIPALALAVQPGPAALPSEAAWQPTSAYVTAGQDEPGYRNWYAASPRHAVGVTGFNQYLATYGVSGIVPTWQLLRTASSWERCGAQPFEVPPTAEWPNIVQTLRYLRDVVIPIVGPVEPVSAYRNPYLNTCAGGAPESAHRHFLAVDLVPLRPIAREAMMSRLCAAHARRGDGYQVGLGFYAFMRFHIDTMKFRKWGAVGTPESSPCAVPLPPPVVLARQPIERIAAPAPISPSAEPAGGPVESTPASR